MLSDTAQPTTLFTRDLFEEFKGACGMCHVLQASGGFKVASTTFSKDMNFKPPTDPDGVLGRLLSNNPDTVMPPESGVASGRDPKTDPYLRLAADLKVWFDQGSPPVLYAPPMATSSGPKFVLSKAVGTNLTNLGNCIPSKDLMFIRKDAADALDQKFAAMTTLPPQLSDTDLTTFDSEVLAQTGVIAYAPAYPLWSDNARKIRHVRVPRGKSIVFNKATQQFELPDNTRFYKTFMKKVIETDGTEHYRKVETRLIVSRNATPSTAPGGDDTQTALFGTYVWSPDETEATLLDDRLNDQKPFADRLVTLIADEAAYNNLTIQHADGGGLGGETLAVALVKAGATRTYALPSSDRCIQCHEGSPSRSFNLGFTPLQVVRRPLGVGGILEAPGADDLTQFDRLRAYGIITGINDASDILPLEASEGTRKPRNDNELVAQGYMIGNCAHCHNPRGFASLSNKDTLQNTLSFLPGPADYQGIFQMSLEKYSPRITREAGGSVRIPYITPSLYDYPSQDDVTRTAQHSLFAPDDGTSPSSYAPAYFVLAPWRSLIYRNVDSPFAYAADLALFPHMPMNVPGFDCRLPRIMGDWMVSIPAVRKSSEPERNVPGDQLDLQTQLHDNSSTDTSEQPYQEVHPGDSAYPGALAAAQARLQQYHTGGKTDYSRYTYCPDTTDIVDFTVTGADINHLTPGDAFVVRDPQTNQTYRIPADYKPTIPGTTTTISNNFDHDEEGRALSAVVAGSSPVWPSEGIPDRPHWVRTDNTDAPGPWQPRQLQWSDVLVEHKYPSEAELPTVPNLTPDQNLKQYETVVQFLTHQDSASGTDGIDASITARDTGAHLSANVKKYVTSKIAYGLWKESSCTSSKLANEHTVSFFTGANRPLWMDVGSSNAPWGPNAPAPDAHVYSELPGAAIFAMVCVNCHGPNADSHGRQADTLQIMTGGNARVADFRDGLFGPVTQPGSNFERVFTVTTPASKSAGLTAEDWAARYMAFMALGGTTKLIPKAILNVVANTQVFGKQRSVPDVGSANMLGTIQLLCARVLYSSAIDSRFATSPDDPLLRIPIWMNSVNWTANFPWVHSFDQQINSGVIMDWFGDAELFARLCSIDNPPPVRQINLPSGDLNYIDLSSVPPNTLLGDGRGGVDTVANSAATNTLPWCIDPTSNSDSVATAAHAWKPVGPDGKAQLPMCPSSTVVKTMSQNALQKWALRGAVNGGFAVFEYLKSILVDKTQTVLPPWDHCDQLP